MRSLRNESGAAARHSQAVAEWPCFDAHCQLDDITSPFRRSKA